MAALVVLPMRSARATRGLMCVASQPRWRSRQGLGSIYADRRAFWWGGRSDSGDGNEADGGASGNAPREVPDSADGDAKVGKGRRSHAGKNTTGANLNVSGAAGTPSVSEPNTSTEKASQSVGSSSIGSEGDRGDRGGKGEDAAPQGSSLANRGGAGDDAPAESGAIIPVSSGHGLRRDTGGAFDPRLIALPLPRRPLFPGQQQLLYITQPEVIKEVMALLEKGSPPLLGAFLRKSDQEPTRQPRGVVEHLTFDNLGVDDAAESLYTVGTRARIAQVASSQVSGDSSSLQVLLHGHDLIRMEKVLEAGPPLQVQVSRIRYGGADGKGLQDDDVRAFINETMHTIREIMKVNPQFREHAALLHQGIERLERGDPHAIAHFAASLTTASGAELMTVLEADQPADKLRLALVLLRKELELSQLQQKISTQIEEKVSGKQREYVLREQLNYIKNELGEGKSDGMDALLQKFKDRLEGKAVPEEVKEAINAEMEKFSSLSKESQEYQMTRNYLDWLTMVPWAVHSKDSLSLSVAREILDRDHYGLTDVKERILELIAVGRLRGSVQGKIMCFVGPPGVGKTSIGRSIAEALGREFYRFSVGGLYDVAEIKGHRRTYVGSMPGKMIQCLKKTQTANPLVLIDEVDKIGRGHQGDPASALLELLDPSQNGSFLDHYLDVPVDCSKVLFVCTANVTDTIPGPLLDRMEVIRLSGYDHNEKVQIAQNYLVPAAMREVGLWRPVAELPKEAGEEKAADETSRESTDEKGELAPPAPKVETDADTMLATLGADASISAEALEALIRWYCREAGVRNLQKQVEKICRKLATKLVERHEISEKKPSSSTADASSDADKTVDDPSTVSGANDELQLHVTDAHLSDLVGKPPFTSDRLYESQLPAGTVTGLAWTSMGGAVLYVESTALLRPEAAKSASPTLTVTGQLGAVMKESSQLALLVARRQLAARASDKQDLSSFFEGHELFLHCPEGATPKDGPSAGITMVTSLLSLALDRAVRVDLAMTGEVTLNGKVLPVGGIKEKTIAARRAGCGALVFPEQNRRDFDELPEYIREGLEVHFASEYNDVFRIAFPENDSSPAIGQD